MIVLFQSQTILKLQFIIMPSNRTNSEWTHIISRAQTAVKSTNQPSTPVAKLLAPISTYIDHTLLKLDATEAQIDALCTEAVTEGFATVCVRGNFVSRAKAALKGSEVGIACVVGFHEGTQSTESKVGEARRAVGDGASEVDGVMNWGWLKEGRYGEVYSELEAIREGVGKMVVVKIIFETSQLSEDEVIAASVLAGYAGLDFIKTSTGFCGRGAIVEDVRLMSAAAGYLEEQGIGSVDMNGKVKRMRVKAAGGVRGFGDAVKMIEAGASRIGTSSGMKIMEEDKAARKGEGMSGDTVVANGEGGY